MMLPSNSYDETLGVAHTIFGNELCEGYAATHVEAARDVCGADVQCCRHVHLAQTALQEKLEKISGKKVRLVTKTDPRVIAGVRVEIEGKQLDGTAAGRMAGISRRLEETIVS